MPENAAAGTLGALLAEARAALAKPASRTPNLDARLIVEHFSGTNSDERDHPPGSWSIDAEVVDAMRRAIARRAAGEPVHRILGFRDFYGLRLYPFARNAGASPRHGNAGRRHASLPAPNCRKGGGLPHPRSRHRHGRHSLALLAEVPQATAVGVDISADALATASRNARENGLSGRFQTVRSDWFEKISGAYHAIVANPPYIPTNELETLQSEVRNFDPARALDGGADGLDAYRTIAEQAKAYLEATGRVAVEIGHTQKKDVSRLFEAAGFRIVEARKDLAGRDRVLVFQRG